MPIDEETILWLALITLAIVGVWNAILSYKMWKAWNKEHAAVKGAEEPEMIAEPKEEAPPAPPEPQRQEEIPPPPPAEPEPPAEPVVEEPPAEPAPEEPRVEFEETEELPPESDEGEVIDLVPKD